MNLLDIILITPIIFGLARGLYKGLINELASLISLIAGIFLAYYFSDSLFTFLSSYIDEPGSGTRALAYAIIFLGTTIIVMLIARALTKLLKLVALGWVNRILGGIFGLLKFLLLLLVIIHFLDPIIKNQDFYESETLKESITYPVYLEYSHFLGGYVDEVKNQTNSPI